MKIATWNINSIRLRLNQVERFIKEKNRFVMSTGNKTPDEYFPKNEFKNMALNINIIEEKNLIMVLILSKFKFDKSGYIN